MNCDKGAWIVKGVEGEVYAIKNAALSWVRIPHFKNRLLCVLTSARIVDSRSAIAKKPSILRGLFSVCYLGVVIPWYSSFKRGGHIEFILDDNNDNNFSVDTLEGIMSCHKGDWIVKGVEGEVYAIKNYSH
jgi:hypothetical protein